MRAYSQNGNLPVLKKGIWAHSRNGNIYKIDSLYLKVEMNKDLVNNIPRARNSHVGVYPLEVL